MVKWLMIAVALMVPSCALIDASSGGDEQLVCGWQPCSCGWDGCDPRVACTQVGCNTCDDDGDCGVLDFCNDGICNSCYNAQFSAPAELQGPDGELFQCETDPLVSNPTCLRQSCFQ